SSESLGPWGSDAGGVGPSHRVRVDSSSERPPWIIDEADWDLFVTPPSAFQALTSTNVPETTSDWRSVRIDSDVASFDVGRAPKLGELTPTAAVVGPHAPG